MINAANIKVHISQDRMSAYINIIRAGADQAIERGDILAALEKHNIKYGLINGEIDRICELQLFDTDIQIARGLQAEDGADGYLEYLFSFTEDVAPKVKQDGRVDYYDMNIVHPAVKDEALCLLHRPDPGRNGFNVTGAEIKAKQGKPAALPRGRNTYVNDAGDSLLASIDGQIKRSGNNVDVLQEFEVQKDVDFSTGNIQFPGNVTVRGNVLSGFTIQSGGDVVIYGQVERANITAFGNITLHGGMTGQGSGTLRSGGDIYAKFVENSRITATGKIVAECIMHSVARAGVGIELIGKKGLLVGGSARAREYIKAVTVGSPFATLTEVEVGSDPKLNDRLRDIKTEITALESEQSKVEQALKMFRNMESSGIKLQPQKAAVYEKTRNMFEDNREKQIALKAEHDILEEAVRKNTSGFIRVNNFIYSGVKISIANFNTLINTDLQYCTLKNDGDGISVQPF